MNEQPMKAARPRWIVRVLRARRWDRAEDGSVRDRIYRVATRHPRKWYDWGHVAMILTGSPFGGRYREPHPPTIWYRINGRTPIVLHSYEDYRHASQRGEDDWHSIGWNEDGDLRLGYYASGNFYGLNRIEQRLLRRWTRRWRLQDWFGLRTWIYYRALTAAVNGKRPFTCQATPPRGAGGYTHWHCQLKKRHHGAHRFNAYEWTDYGRVEHRPQEVHS